jgi:hypothetical protein
LGGNLRLPLTSAGACAAALAAQGEIGKDLHYYTIGPAGSVAHVSVLLGGFRFPR